MVKKVRQVWDGGFRGRRRYLATVECATSIPNLSRVLPTMGSLDSCSESSSESSSEFLRPRSVFPDAAGICASSTTRTLYGAKR